VQGEERRCIESERGAWRGSRVYGEGGGCMRKVKTREREEGSRNSRKVDGEAVVSRPPRPNSEKLVLLILSL
jgi:hypothetical protein